MSWPYTRRRKVGKYFHRSAPETHPHESVKKFFFVSGIAVGGFVITCVFALMQVH